MKAQRIIAYIIDAIFIGIVCSILCLVAGLEVQSVWASGGIEVMYNPVTLFWLGTSVLYFLMDGLRGGSPGKTILGLTVTSGSTATSLSAALIRSLVKVLSIHVLIGVILFLIGDEGSSLHDKIAGTRVQKKIAVA